MFDKSVAAAIANQMACFIFLDPFGRSRGLFLYKDEHRRLSGYFGCAGSDYRGYPGRAAEEVEQQITIPLENTMASIPHHEVIRSRTIFGLSLVQIIFEPGVDDYWASEVAFQKIGDAGLPSDAQASMAPLDTAYGEIYRYELQGDAAHGPLELRELNDWVITPRLAQSQRCRRSGEFRRTWKTICRATGPAKLLQYGVKLQDLEAAIKANNSSGGGSFLERGSTSLVIRGLGSSRITRN